MGGGAAVFCAGGFADNGPGTFGDGGFVAVTLALAGAAGAGGGAMLAGFSRNSERS